MGITEDVEFCAKDEVAVPFSKTETLDNTNESNTEAVIAALSDTEVVESIGESEEEELVIAFGAMKVLVFRISSKTELRCLLGLDCVECSLDVGALVVSMAEAGLE